MFYYFALLQLALRINEYSPDIKYFDGKQNSVADFLSRLFEDDPVAEVFTVEDDLPLSFAHISSKQQEDSKLIYYIHAISTGHL